MMSHASCEHENSKAARARCRRGLSPDIKTSQTARKTSSTKRTKSRVNPATCPHLDTVTENGQKWCKRCNASLIRWGNSTVRFNPPKTQKRNK